MFQDLKSLVNAAGVPYFDLKVHSGYLHGARALQVDIEKEVLACMEFTSIRHVIFTGHSAGGAVASLAFLQTLAVASARCTCMANDIRASGLMSYKIRGFASPSSPLAVRQSLHRH